MRICDCFFPITQWPVVTASAVGCCLSDQCLQHTQTCFIRFRSLIANHSKQPSILEFFHFFCCNLLKVSQPTHFLLFIFFSRTNQECLKEKRERLSRVTRVLVTRTERKGVAPDSFPAVTCS